MDALLPALAIAGALGLLTWALLAQAQERAVVRASLRQLEGYEVENLRERELLNPLRERAIAPVFVTFSKLGRRFLPSGYAENSRVKLIRAGYQNADALDRFLSLRVIGVVLVPLWFLLAYRVLSLEGNMQFYVFLLLSLFSVLGPDAVLNRKVEERQLAIRIKLPDILDLLVISVEAGLGFDQALDRTVSAVPGPLSDEFTRMLGETRAGHTRADSMRAMDERIGVPEIKSFVLAILQADTFGISIGRVLRSQADEMRVKRRQLAQERAQKAPVKMLIPMVFCIFPALFVVVLGPAMINIIENF
jgi:tight adherence protein C